MSTEPSTPHPSDDPALGPGVEPPKASAPTERLHRRRHGRMVAGVAGGLADYLDVDPALVRIGFVALALLGGLAIPLYIGGWLVIPDEGGGPTVAEELLARERAW
jgi:phage shock protein PspC (stress-responsive transcriptional regulator)